QKELDECLTSVMPEGSLGMIKILVRHGSKLTIFSFFKAIRREEPAVFQLLIDHGWNIDSTEFEVTAVHAALRHDKLLRWLLEHGANPNIMSTRSRGSCAERRTPLVAAARMSDATPLEILLSYGTKLDPMVIFSAIWVRRYENGVATMAALLAHGVDVNYMSERLGTPLLYAVHRLRKEKVSFLMANGADPTIPCPASGLTAIEFAKKRGLVEILDILE
ncbi:ankyrin, partial [Cucurbitaria berberidis CBS 394.84]